MSAQRDGGPISYVKGGGARDDFGNSLDHPGMSLRDWFAGQALAGCAIWSFANAEKLGMPMAKTGAADAYAIADAMLTAREVRS